MGLEEYFQIFNLGVFRLNLALYVLVRFCTGILFSNDVRELISYENDTYLSLGMGLSDTFWVVGSTGGGCGG